VNGTVRAGESLGSILRREGLTPPESDEVIRALAPVMNFKKEIRAGQKYALRYDDQGRLVGFELRASPITVYEVAPGADGKLVGRKVAGAKTEVRVHEISGTVTSSLYGAIKDLGEQTQLVAELVDLFAYDINFYVDTHDGDRFKVIVEKHYIDGAFWRYGKVLAAEYSGNVGTYRAFHWQAPGARAGGYYDDKGQNIEKSMLKTPLKFTRVSSKFNPRRMHPVLHTVRGHFGTDYAAPTGTPVWASASGKVVWVGPKGGSGNLVVIEHGGGLQTLYMHLSKFAKGLRVGQRVSQKQVIGYVGSTGLATGPHLHFSVKQNGRYVDPQKLRPVRAAPIAAKHREQFDREIADRRVALDKLSTVATSPTAAKTQ
jgi:YD repeat-containing protein